MYSKKKKEKRKKENVNKIQFFHPFLYNIKGYTSQIS